MAQIYKLLFFVNIFLSLFYINLDFIKKDFQTLFSRFELPNNLFGIFDIYFLFLTIFILFMFILKKIRISFKELIEIKYYLIFFIYSLIILISNLFFMQEIYGLYSYLITLKKLHWIVIFIVSTILIKKANFKKSEILVVFNFLLLSLIVYSLAFIYFNFSDPNIRITSDQRMDLPFVIGETSNILSFLIIFLILLNFAIFYEKSFKEIFINFNLSINFSFIFVLFFLGLFTFSRSGLYGLFLSLFIFIFINLILSKNVKKISFSFIFFIFIVLSSLLFISISINFNIKLENVIGVIDFDTNSVLSRFFYNYYPLVERFDMLFGFLNLIENKSTSSYFNYIHFFIGSGAGHVRISDNLYLTLFFNYGLIGTLLFLYFIFKLFYYKNTYLVFLCIYIFTTSFTSEYIIHSQRYLNFFFCIMPVLFYYLKKNENFNY